MQTVIRKIWGEVWRRKSRTVLVSLSIMIGVFGAVTMISGNDLITSQLDGDIQPDHMAMLRLYVTLPEGEVPLEENQRLVDQLAQLEGVTDIEGQAMYPVDWRPAGSDRRYDGAFIFAYTQPLDSIDLEPISKIQEGRLPQPGQHEIAVELRFAVANSLELGDRLTFRPTSPDADPVEYEIVGIVTHSYFTFSPIITDPVMPDLRIFALYEDAQQITGFSGLTSFYVRYTDYATAQGSIDTFTQAVASQTPYVPVMNFVDDPDDSSFLKTVDQICGILQLLGLIAMVVSGFLVINVMNVMLAEQKRQIGVLKLLGASRLELIAIYAGIALVYGILGTIPGLLLGIPAGWFLSNAVPEVGYPEGFRVSTQGLLVGTTMGLLVPVLVVILPVWNATRVSILTAMSDVGIASAWGHSRMSRLVGQLPLPVVIRQAICNVSQRALRLALTTLTLMMAVGVFMGVIAVFTAVQERIKSISDTFDFAVVIEPQQAQDINQFTDLLSDVEGVRDIYPSYSAAVRVEGYQAGESVMARSSQVSAQGVDPDHSAFRFDLQEGDGWMGNPNEAIITFTVADKLGKHAGDTLVVTTRGQSHEFTIVGVDRYPFDALFFRWQELAVLTGYVDGEGNPLPDAFLVQLTSSTASINEVNDRIADLEALLLDHGIAATYINQTEVTQDEASETTMLVVIFNIAAGVMALVGIVGLLATLSMSVFERQREIGIMRSVGAGSVTIAAQFLTEGILVGVLAWVASIPVSYVLSLQLVDMMPFARTMQFVYPLIVLAIGLGGMLAVTALASLGPSISASRRTVSAILRYQ